MILKKLYKWFTYKKRKERILHNIYKRIIKRYPNLPMYNSLTGKKILNSYDLQTYYFYRYNPVSGDKIFWYKNWIVILYDKEGSTYYKFKITGKLFKVDENRTGMLEINKINVYTPDENINEIFYKYKERSKRMTDRYK